MRFFIVKFDFFKISTIIKQQCIIVEIFMYKERSLEKQIIELSNKFKVLLITGARQVGKSTLLKHCDKNRNYVTLDDYKARKLAIKEPELFLQRYKAPIIIDEIQYAPNLLSYIKIAVDNSDEKEIDVIIEKNDKLYLVKIKKSANPDKSMLKHFSVIPEDKRGEGAIIYL